MKLRDIKNYIILTFTIVLISACSPKDVIEGTIDSMAHGVFGYWNSTQYNIPDNNSSGIESVIEVDTHTSSASINELSVFINIEHQAAGDLKISLTSPSGTTANLMEYRGTTQTLNKIKFEDNASKAIINFDTSTHIYRPEVALSIFNSENPNGNWKLNIIDNQATKTGKINAWQLKFATD